MMARRSTSEVQSQLYLALDRSFITEAERKRTDELALEAKKLINGLISYLRNSNRKRLSDYKTF
jgi:four helix bundle protein